MPITLDEQTRRYNALDKSNKELLNMVRSARNHNIDYYKHQSDKMKPVTDKIETLTKVMAPVAMNPVAMNPVFIGHQPNAVIPHQPNVAIAHQPNVAGAIDQQPVAVDRQPVAIEPDILDPATVRKQITKLESFIPNTEIEKLAYKEILNSRNSGIPDTFQIVEYADKKIRFGIYSEFTDKMIELYKLKDHWFTFHGDIIIVHKGDQNPIEIELTEDLIGFLTHDIVSNSNLYALDAFKKY